MLFAHPALEKSRVNQRLFRAISDLPGITTHDLYERYPEFDIDVDHEQRLLVEHDVIVLQHPFYWYSTPAIVKEWEDLVLQHGWAYGRTGNALQGKVMLSAITTGGGEDAYREDGAARFTVRQLLAPIEQTAFLCGMDYLPPHVVHGTHRMREEEMDTHADNYRFLLAAMRDDRVDFKRAHKQTRINANLNKIIKQEA